MVDRATSNEYLASRRRRADSTQTQGSWSQPRASMRPARPGEGPPQRSGEENGGAERSGQESRRRREKRREEGVGGWEEIRQRKNNHGRLKYHNKSHCRYYRLQGPVPPASQRSTRAVLRDFGLPVLPGFGRYHRLEPVPPGLCVGTTGRTGNQGRGERSGANLETNQSWPDFIKSLQNNGHA